MQRLSLLISALVLALCLIRHPLHLRTESPVVLPLLAAPQAKSATR